MKKSISIKKQLARFRAAIIICLLGCGLFPSNTLASFTIQILHSSDNESSFQDPNTLEPKILHFSAVLNGLREIAKQEKIPSVFITAGDHTLRGPFYEAAAHVESLGAPGIGDIALFNAMQLSANGMGNHEFDGGIDDFARMVSRADYPFIAANLDFGKVKLGPGVPPIQIGEDAGSVTENAGKVVKSAFVTVGKERIGLIGRAPADFFNVIKNPAKTLPGLDFAGGRHPETNRAYVSALAQITEQVRLLEAKGINKIILLDHAQDFTHDPLSAASLRGIDIIITAGSTGIMARPSPSGPFNRLREGDKALNDYPVIRRDSEGYFVLVVKSEQQYEYIGHLIASFDSSGHIVRIDSRSGPVATTPENLSAFEPLTGSRPAPSPQAASVFKALAETPLIRDQFEIIGETTAPLNGLRADVRSRETNLGRLAAESSLWYARKALPHQAVDAALKNGGGIRDGIPGPKITRLAVSSALAFDNNLSVVELTAAGLAAMMENSVSRVPYRDGRFPQVAGMRLEYDPQKPGLPDLARCVEPSRIRSLVILHPGGSDDVVVENGIFKGEPERIFRIVTNDFLLGGGDGYQALKHGAETRDTEPLPLKERQVMIDYIRQVQGGKVDMPEPLKDALVEISK